MHADTQANVPVFVQTRWQEGQVRATASMHEVRSHRHYANSLEGVCVCLHFSALPTELPPWASVLYCACTRQIRKRWFLWSPCPHIHPKLFLGHCNRKWFHLNAQWKQGEQRPPNLWVSRGFDMLSIFELLSVLSMAAVLRFGRLHGRMIHDKHSG